MLPQITRVIAGIDHWLCPMYADRPELDFDPDSISALTDKRQAQWNKIQNATFLTRNERREAAGYGPVPGGDATNDGGTDSDDDLAKFNPYHDELGRFTTGPGAGAADSGDNTNAPAHNTQPSSQPASSPDGSQPQSAPGKPGQGSGPWALPDHSPAMVPTPASADQNSEWPKQGNSGLNVNNAVQALDNNAQDGPTGHCAGYVHAAISAGGVQITPPTSAYAQDYGPSLENAGFVQLTPTPAPDYDAQPGDVVVINITREEILLVIWRCTTGIIGYQILYKTAITYPVMIIYGRGPIIVNNNHNMKSTALNSGR